MEKYYVSIVIVTVKARANYRPRVSKYKFGYFSDVKSAIFQLTAKEECIDAVKRQLEEQNPGVNLSYSASIEVNLVVGILGYTENDNEK